MQNKLDRFLSLITDTSNPDACWIWNAGKAGAYGKFWMDGKTFSAHKASYLLHKGEVPEFKIIRHTCHQPLCVNPKHLILGTYQDNAKDMIESGRVLVGEKNGASTLKERQASEIIRRFNLGHKERTMACEMGVSRGAVRNITKGFGWKHLKRQAAL